MKLFGDQNAFAIEYEFSLNSNNDTDGYIRLWVNGRNICGFNQNREDVCDLYHIVDWFCDKLDYILGYDPFPVPAEGLTALELMDNAYQYETDDQLEFDLWYSALNRWNLNHCWLVARGGSVLPRAFFRRSNDSIELSWDNFFWEKHEITFQSRKGVYTVEYRTFLDILSEFLFSIIADLESRVRSEERIREIRSSKKHINLMLKEWRA